MRKRTVNNGLRTRTDARVINRPLQIGRRTLSAAHTLLEPIHKPSSRKVAAAIDDCKRSTMEQTATQSYLEDRLSIADLMTGWIHRDLGEWDQLRNLFHHEATIDITWFAGKAADFVDGSIRMGASNFKAKHVITSPIVTFNGYKAIAETNAIVVVDNAVLKVG